SSLPFFFFQAEVGIRDRNVTGVQTCALPFSRRFRHKVSFLFYGLLCSRTKNKKLTLCRNLLGCKKYLSRIKDKEMPEVLELLYEIGRASCRESAKRAVDPGAGQKKLKKARDA